MEKKRYDGIPGQEQNKHSGLQCSISNLGFLVSFSVIHKIDFPHYLIFIKTAKIVLAKFSV